MAEDLEELAKRLRAMSREDFAKLREMIGREAEDDEERASWPGVNGVPTYGPVEDEPPPFEGRPRPGGAMDAAPSSFGAALAEVRATLPGLAFYSNSTALGLYGAAAQRLGVNTRGTDPSRWPGMFRRARDQRVPSFAKMFPHAARVAVNHAGEPISTAAAALAADSVRSFAETFPDAARINIDAVGGGR